MNSQEIKSAFAQLEAVKIEALRILKEVDKGLQHSIHPDDASIEPIDTGLIIHFYYKGDDHHATIPWSVFDEGVEAWQREVEKKRLEALERERLQREENERKSRDYRYQNYLKLKEEFEND